MASTWIDGGAFEMPSGGDLYAFLGGGGGAAAFFDSHWAPLEAELMTRALQVSLSHGSSPDSSCAPSPVASSPLPTFLPDTSPPPQRKPETRVAGGRITKRKPRASKKTPITYIEANPANFREMVQQITGIQSGEVAAAVDRAASAGRPDRQRLAAPSQGFLPTLDTSAFLLDRSAPTVAVAGVEAEAEAGVVAAENGFGDFPVFDSLLPFDMFEGFGF